MATRPDLFGTGVERGRAAAEIILRSLRSAGGWAGESARRAAGHLGRHRRREPLPSRPLVVVAASLAAGCAVAICWELSPLVCWLLGAAGVCLWLALFRRGNSPAAAVVLVVSIACAGAGWSAARWNLFSAADLAWSLGPQPGPVALEGVVLQTPQRLPTQGVSTPGHSPMEKASEWLLRVEAVRAGSVWQAAAGRAAVFVEGPPPDLIVGSRIRLFGRGMRPGPALNPGEFDLRERARALRCLSIVRTEGAGAITVLQVPPALTLASLLDEIRARGERTLQACLSPQRAPLAAALLLGSRDSLPSEESQEFLVTGTIHILSISGLHVALLAMALFQLLRAVAVPRQWSLLAVAVATGLYMLLVHPETPVVRATLLVWLSCLGGAVGRRSLALNALAAAAICVLVWHPPEVFRIGSQLSFLSTAVLIGAAAAWHRSAAPADPLERLIEQSRTPLERWLRRAGRSVGELVLLGTAVWVVTAPLVAQRFHLVSPVGLLLNPVLSPLVALAMGWGFLCLAAAPFSTLLAGLCGAGCDATLGLISACVSWAAALPGGYAWVCGPPGWWVAGWYLLLVLILLWMPAHRLRSLRTWGVVVIAWLGVGQVAATVSYFCTRPLQLEAVVVAMGHGCGIVVRSPTGRCLVYDAGRLGAPGAARRAMAAVLWSEGVQRIDTLVISHADADHFNAVPELLERFSVGEVVVSRAFLQSDSFAVGDLLRKTQATGVPVKTVAAGDALPFDDLCRVRVLHPKREPNPEDDASAAEPEASDDNQSSLVLAVESAGRRLLLTGDLEGEALERFVGADPDPCDALVAPHHGSGTTLPPALATATVPDWVIVSGVGGARWGEVRDAYANSRSDGRPARVLKTGGEGAIRLRFTAAGTSVQQFRSGFWVDVATPDAGVGTTLTPLSSPASAAILRPPITPRWR